jgi:biofilm PGA synthesis lipoprotein PgaB
MGGIVLAAIFSTWFVNGGVLIARELTRSTGPIVVALRYHDISEDPRSRVEAVSPGEFQAQVRALKETGWQFATVSQLVALAKTPERFPRRVALLTFDEGFASFYHEVLPLLRAEEIPATLAVAPSRIDRPPAGLPRSLTWEQLGEIAESGWVEIASHYGTAARIEGEPARSRRLLEERLGVRVRVIAWPQGESMLEARDIARATGFAATLTLEGSPVGPEDLREGLIPRLAVHPGDRIGDPDLVEWLPGQSGPAAAAVQ